MLEASHFNIFTDHKPITYAFQQKRDKCSPRQFNHLDFVAQFATDMRHISGQDNVVADALSLVKSVTAPPSYDGLAAEVSLLRPEFADIYRTHKYGPFRATKSHR
jgi:hypothetical protein